MRPYVKVTSSVKYFTSVYTWKENMLKSPLTFSAWSLRNDTGTVHVITKYRPTERAG